ncbi:MAG: pantetheine-phosphate adenylyltransferase [Clostridia bacterium]|nr:pantetheine-phosphate adenylyltransferase [Clostridia bacterium]
MRTCVFAGTFDPFTNGHAYIVDKCLETFDKVIVAVGVNVDKKPYFTDDERVQAIKEVYADNERVSVKKYDGMLVDFMKKEGVKVTVRGLRNEDDYKYETTMARYNEDMYPEIITVYIPAPTNLTYVSSTAIKNLIDLNTSFDSYVPEKAAAYLKSVIKNK